MYGDACTQVILSDLLAQQTNHTCNSSGVLTHSNGDRRLAMTINAPLTEDPFADIQATTRRHLAQHGCGAYPFEDGPALISLANEHRPKRVFPYYVP